MVLIYIVVSFIRYVAFENRGISLRSIHYGLLDTVKYYSRFRPYIDCERVDYLHMF